MDTPTLATLLASQAARTPDATFLLFRDSRHSFREVDEDAARLAAGLAGLGVQSGEAVVSLLPNSFDAARLWFATARLGAIWAPINTEFRGPGLAHAINLTRGATLVVDEAMLEFVAPIADQLPTVRRIVVRGSPARAPGARWERLSLADVPADAPAPIAPGTRATDTALLLYTSGTTGPSKACALSHRYVIRQAELTSAAWEASPSDVAYCPFPMFHADATVFTIAPALVHGSAAALVERFSVSRFWSDIRTFGATTFDYMGATLALLFKQPPREDDRDNPARLGWGVPRPDFAPAFEERFGVTLVEGYGSTEAGIPVVQYPGKSYPPGACGRVRAEYEVRIGDDEDDPVPTGAVGEILVRAREPFLTMTEYFGMPDATARAFRNCWFHSGDLARMDAAGNLYFVGRKKDAIRRRGENISLFEIEQVVDTHPAVLESAAYGVPSALTEEDVAIAVVLRSGAAPDPAELIRFCQERMARYMVPLYVTFWDSLPKTPTEKVSRVALRERHLERAVTPVTAGPS
ncbi:MAG: AMP-binding protein [Gemmatimonadales bacterium]